MQRYIIRRLMEMVPTTLGVLLLTFILFHVVGGSPAEVVLGKNASAEALAVFDARYGYDRPLLCGNWCRLRVMGPIARTRLTPDSSTGLCRLPLAYALPAGRYRVDAGRVVLGLLQSTTGETDQVMVDGSSPITFSIREGWKAETIDVGDTLPAVVKLEARTAGFFDSQLVHYLRLLVQGDFGLSTEHNRPVAAILREGMGPSLSLTVPILIGGTVIGVMLGLLCAAWRGGVVDRAVLILSTVLMSVNYVVWVLAGQFLFAFKWRLFPIWGFESAAYLVLPVIIGVVSGLGRDVRFFRAAILDEVYKPYVRTAQAKGLSGTRIMVRHVLRNSLIPIVTYVSLSIPFLFTGSLMLESFFGIPGLGNVSLNALHSSDMAVVWAVVILGALLYQGVNLVTDLCYVWLDPRVRVG